MVTKDRKWTQYRYLVLGPFLIQSPINTDPGIGLLTVWMIPKCKAYSPQVLGAGSGFQCDPNPNPISWDWITLRNLIPYFLIPGIEKSIRSDKSADTVLDRICFTVAISAVELVVKEIRGGVIGSY
ncbi:Kinesin-like protein kif20a [Puccinia graminis f. sp. tritici]|uniref:Kinesin-like protein kif20a n=1 Tax=Puccinia graminis f. sp. tritici TaxID=56615 RepID=A0A5B0SIQ1_PUCGR|nr:Kinesin-like protein kif20a [Puccinia graminis f. sp. tritici]